jgi:glycosyltransferase involved in cell wall biosynthesis
MSRALAEHRGRVVLRHHDLPWQRRDMVHLDGEFPPRPEGALHVTVNIRSMRELASRRTEAVAMHNRFDLDAPRGDRAAGRAAFGFDDDELVVLQPGRAIERKNVPGGVRLTRDLAALLPERRVRYWLTGPAEDGYGPMLGRVLERAEVPVTLGRAQSAAEAYAACDVVAFPSTWEGFGNPVVESVWARRPLATFPYPVLAEITAYGLQFFSTDAPADLARFVRDPDKTRFDVNLARARKALSLADLPAQIDEAFGDLGWVSW